MAIVVTIKDVRIGESLANRLDDEYPGDWESSTFSIGRFVTAIGDLVPDASKGEFIEILSPNMSQTPFGVDHVLAGIDQEGDYTFQIGVFDPAKQ